LTELTPALVRRVCDCRWSRCADVSSIMWRQRPRPLAVSVSTAAGRLTAAEGV